MRTQQEIEKMKDDIEVKISNLKLRMSVKSTISKIDGLSEQHRQLMAQYNILLEVLK